MSSFQEIEVTLGYLFVFRSLRIKKGNQELSFSLLAALVHPFFLLYLWYWYWLYSSFYHRRYNLLHAWLYSKGDITLTILHVVYLNYLYGKMYCRYVVLKFQTSKFNFFHLYSNFCFNFNEKEGKSFPTRFLTSLLFL